MTTPRTDEKLIDCGYDCGNTHHENFHVSADFARTLERELTSALERERRLREVLSKAQACLISWKEYDGSNPTPEYIEAWGEQDDETLQQIEQALSTPAPDHFRDAGKMVPWEVVAEHIRQIQDIECFGDYGQKRLDDAVKKLQSFAPKEGE